MIQFWKNLRGRIRFQHIRLAVIVFIFLSCILIPVGGYIIETREPACRPKIVTLRVSGNSMLPVLHNGESISTEDLMAGCSQLSRGDIVVVKSLLDSSTQMVKRLAAVPGDFVTRSQKNQLIISDLPAINIEKSTI
jgi:signal peptidase I